MDSFVPEADNKEAQRSHDAYVQRLHRVFVQNQDGAELLKRWKDDVLMSPSILPHYTEFEAGLAEGGKNVIRSIINAIQSVESQS